MTVQPIDWATIEKQVVELAADIFKGFTKQALLDLNDFRSKTDSQLIEWLQALGKGEITQKNFHHLVMGQKSLAEMTALKQKGIAFVALDKFTDGVLNIIISVAKTSIKF